MKRSQIHLPPDQYRLIIFDLDGTLYYQPPLRLHMALLLTVHYLTHPLHIRELLALKRYRSLREKAAQNSPAKPADLADPTDPANLSSIAGAPFGLSAAETQEVVQTWLYRAPLPVLKQYRDETLCEILYGLQRKDIVTAVYSDYPVEEKLKALELDFPFRFCADDEEIRRMKPDPTGILFILKSLQIPPKKALMIGDRMEKDGCAALAAGIDYLILPRGRRRRQKRLKDLSFLR